MNSAICSPRKFRFTRVPFRLTLQARSQFPIETEPFSLTGSCVARARDYAFIEHAEGAALLGRPSGKAVWQKCCAPCLVNIHTACCREKRSTRKQFVCRHLPAHTRCFKLDGFKRCPKSGIESACSGAVHSLRVAE